MLNSIVQKLQGQQMMLSPCWSTVSWWYEPREQSRIMNRASDKQLLITCLVTINSMIAPPPPTFNTHAASKMAFRKSPFYLCSLNLLQHTASGLSKKSIT